MLGRVPNRIFDVEDVRRICQDMMSQLPLTRHLHNERGRAVRSRGHPAPNPTTERAGMSAGPPFFSYLRDDLARVSSIVNHLQSNGIAVWIDLDDLTAGEPWRRGISKAIRACSHFVAFFSKSYGDRIQTYMDEEIQLALSEMVRLGRTRSWFIPVLLDAGQLPAIQIDARHTLKDLHFIDFSLDWNSAIAHLSRNLENR